MVVQGLYQVGANISSIGKRIAELQCFIYYTNLIWFLLFLVVFTHVLIVSIICVRYHVSLSLDVKEGSTNVRPS